MLLLLGVIELKRHVQEQELAFVAVPGLRNGKLGRLLPLLLVMTAATMAVTGHCPDMSYHVGIGLSVVSWSFDFLYSREPENESYCPNNA
jgi:hypothetical protein